MTAVCNCEVMVCSALTLSVLLGMRSGYFLHLSFPMLIELHPGNPINPRTSLRGKIPKKRRLPVVGLELSYCVLHTPIPLTTPISCLFLDSIPMKWRCSSEAVWNNADGTVERETGITSGTRGPLGPGPSFAPKFFSANFKGKPPILSTFWAQGPPLGSPLRCPLTKILGPPLGSTPRLQQRTWIRTVRVVHGEDVTSQLGVEILNRQHQVLKKHKVQWSSLPGRCCVKRIAPNGLG